jgi:hypothetical protein
MAYGLAGIFNLLSVSIETLQKEAFVGKEITKEQYDQLQALGKTEEEKEVDFEMGKRDGDSPIAVTDRIQKLANANVPRALVKLLDGSNTDTTQQKLLEGMGRMASEPSVRGIMIQQGCLSACLELDKGVRNSVLPSSHLIDYLANCHIYIYSGQTKRIRKEHIETCEELCCQTTDYYQPKHFDSIPTMWIHRPLDQTRQRQ